MPPSSEHVEQPKQSGRSFWLPIVLALLVPTIYAVFLGGSVSKEIDVLAQTNQEALDELDELDEAYVPRREIDLKLQNLQLQVKGVQSEVGDLRTDVESLKTQSARQTKEIIDSIRRIGSSPQ